jgi:pimeloyl-ACP methyl ester carboxylesterase
VREEPALAGAEHARVDVGEVTLHVVSMGRGPPVVLLHGFPELWWSWRHQLPALAAAGRLAVAPDLRGFGGSDRPRGVEAYALHRLAGDVAGLVRALGAGPAAIVGHDWGGVLAWAVAARHPELVERLVVLNAPHPSAMLRALRRPRQLLRSSYMLLFQLPVLPERLLAACDHALLRRALRASRARPVPDAELEPYVAAAREAGLGGGLDWYRAMGRALLRGRAGRGGAGRRVEAPALVVWGERDPFLGPELATPPADRVPDARVLRIAEAGHWVQLDAPAQVNAAILGFLAEPPRPERPRPAAGG